MSTSNKIDLTFRRKDSFKNKALLIAQTFFSLLLTVLSSLHNSFG